MAEEVFHSARQLPVEVFHSARELPVAATGAAGAASGWRGLRLSSAIWQPDGLYLASLREERAEDIAERREALEEEANAPFARGEIDARADAA